MSEIQKINLINIIKKSLRFLIFEWKFFAVVLGFYIFRYFTYGSNSYTDYDPTQVFYELVVKDISRNFFYLLFWVSIIPLIILAVKEYLTKQQRISFKKDMIIRYFIPLFAYQFLFSVLDFLISSVSALAMFNSILMPEPVITLFVVFLSMFGFILGFILFLAPVIIVLENKTFIDSTKKSFGIIRNTFKESVIFYLMLVIVIDFLFLFPGNIKFWYQVMTGIDIVIPGFNYLQLILSSGWFIFYNAAIVGFYLNISEDRKLTQVLYLNESE